MTTVLTFATFSALIWAGFKYYSVYFALVDSFPPEWRDSVTSRFAIDQFALSPSTPLAVQADYVASQLGACLAAFFLWLLVFLVGQTIERWLFLAILLVFAASTVKSARLYWKNRNRSIIGSQEENI